MADPFADRNTLDANPFADPTVRNALSSSNRAYDDDQQDDYDAKSWNGQEEEGHTRGATGSSGGPDSQARLEELQRRERELEQRERDLAARADHIQKHGRNNWPFFWPLIYHDIKAEIPAGDLQIAMTHIYYLWLLLVATLVVNFVACLFTSVYDLITSVIYLPLISIASFMLWYRPIYNGFMKEHALFYYVYFIFAGFHLAFSVYALIGIPETGCAGIFNCIESFGKGKIVAGALSIPATIGFAVQGAGNLWYYKQIWKHNREQGHSFTQARAELASHGAKAYFTRGSNV